MQCCCGSVPTPSNAHRAGRCGSPQNSRRDRGRDWSCSIGHVFDPGMHFSEIDVGVSIALMKKVMQFNWVIQNPWWSMMMQDPGDINEIQMDASTKLPTDPISKPSAWWPFRASSGFAKHRYNRSDFTIQKTNIAMRIKPPRKYDQSVSVYWRVSNSGAERWQTKSVLDG